MNVEKYSPDLEYNPNASVGSHATAQGTPKQL